MKQIHSVHERVIQYAQMPAERVLTDLAVSEGGLTDMQVEAYRSAYGNNRIIGKKRDTILTRLRRAFVNPFSIVTFLIAVISFLTDVLFPSNFSRDVSNVVIILIMLLVSGIVRFVQEMRSRKVADDLTRLVHATVPVKRNHEWMDLPAEQLVVGDLVRLDAGDRIPADIRLTRATNFFVTQSLITGESDIPEKTTEPTKGRPDEIEDYTNTVFLGSTVMGGTAEGVVLAVGADTMYGGFSVEEKDWKSGFDRGEEAIAWVLIRFMLILVPIVFLACGLTKGAWLAAFLFALSVAVDLAPELLPMVITACLAKSSAKMSREQTVVKDINAMEAFGSMDVLCLDKTGTLTGDTVLLEYYMDILGNECEEVLDAAYLNSYYHTGVANHLDTAILSADTMPGKEQHFKELTESYSKLDEIPFDYTRKAVSVLVQKDEEKLLLVKGNVDDVISRCSYTEYKGERTEIGEDVFASVHAIIDEMTEDGMKIIAVAKKTLEGKSLATEDESDLTLIGYVAFFDAPKESAGSAVQALRGLNLNVKVLTGDHEEVTASVCKRLGFSFQEVITGVMLDEIPEEELPEKIENGVVFAELSPRQKAGIVEILQENGHSVGFLGDGMNDLPAIVQADVGVSVENAADALKESGEVILLKKDLNVLGEGIVEGRKTFLNMSKYIKITAASNFGTIAAIVAASVLLPFFPITATELLFLDLLYDMICLILPWDKVGKDQYEKPIEWTGKNLSRFMLIFGPIATVFDFGMFAFLYFFFCPAVCGGAFASLDAAGQNLFTALFQTGWFLETLWTQVMTLHLLRTKKRLFFLDSASKPVWCVTGLGILFFTVFALTGLGSVIGLTAMPVVFLAFLIVHVLLYFIVVTIVKEWYIRRYNDLI